jgi:hypothetical protein
MPTLCLDDAMLTRRPPEVQRALMNHPMGPPPSALTVEAYTNYRIRLPYGRSVAPDGTKTLFNANKRPMLAWKPGAREPERCYPHPARRDIDPAAGGALVDFFYEDAAVGWVGREALWHAVATLAAAWERGDRATADVLEEWLIAKRKTYRQITRSYWSDLEQWKLERSFLEDILYGSSSPAKPASTTPPEQKPA